MNDTLQFLLDSVLKSRAEFCSADPEHQRKTHNYDELLNEFKRTHAGDQALISDIIHLLDAQFSCTLSSDETMFLLGLQMGQELRDIHLMPPEG